MGLFNREDKFLKKARKQADQVVALKERFAALDDAALAAKTQEFKHRVQAGESLDALLPEVFAQVREASRRVLGMEHYYVQILGGIILHNGDIAEMKTGEGKTLAATLPVCLNALTGKGVHVVTVNEYLARRDSEWMGKLYRFLGFSVGLLERDADITAKQQAYQADITYGTNNEFGFDYLRDNMKVYQEELVQRELHYAIVDEVDSILIDEARTPLIISGSGDESSELYARADAFVRGLQAETDYEIDEKQKTINLTEQGIARAESYFGLENLSDIQNTTINHHINQALRAHYIMRRDIDYVVQNGEILIVDEFTGRLMVGRRYSDGLHQAIEVKEKVKIKNESKTLATITFQNFFRMYEKLAGMTGTAKTEEAEFEGIYDLGVVEIPTHKPMIREDKPDVVLGTEAQKFEAVIEEICAVHQSGRPLLVGTVSVENSEKLSAMLRRRGVHHEVLNAKNHEKEAYIIAQAGKFGAVTIATNMAGRGTDIILGGNADYLAKYEMHRQGYSEDMIYSASIAMESNDPDVLAARKIYRHLYESFKEETEVDREKVLAAGGLYIIGTERHESRRIDNQLRGRSGRQGDPGASKFYVAFEDELMRLFGGERMQSLMQGMTKGRAVPMEYKMLSKQIERAQKRIEERNFAARSHVLKYDDVMNKQREVIYSQRRKVLLGEDISDTIVGMRHTLLENLVDAQCALGPEGFDAEALIKSAVEVLGIANLKELIRLPVTYENRQKLKAELEEIAQKVYQLKAQEFTAAGDDIKNAERVLLLQAVDEKWMDHIDAMDQLRRGIGLRSYGQTDPVVAFQKEGFDMFDEMIENIGRATVTMLYHVRPGQKVERKRKETALRANYKEEGAAHAKKAAVKPRRNDLCPCGSGKKYKNCHGREA